MKKQELLNLKNKLLTYSLLSSLAIVPVNMNTLNVKANSYNNQYINDVDSTQSINHFITYYSHVFQIKEEIIRKKLLEKTNRLSSYEWNHFYRINNKNYDSIELAILELTRDIYNNYSDYDYTKEEVTDDTEYIVTLTPEEMIAKYSKLYGINKEVALSIVYTECGSDVNSYNYRHNNNPAGLGPNMHFLNKEVGIIYFVNLLKNSYKCEIDSDDSFLNRIASTYCEIPNHWLSLSLPFYNNLKEDYFYYNDNLDGELDIEIYENNIDKQKQKTK